MQEKLPVEDINSFNDVLALAGNHGPFQRKYNLIFNLFIVIFTSMPFLNIVIAMHTTNHWCKVPGREKTPYNIDEWKNLTVPRTYDSKGIISFSKCTMYNMSTSLKESSTAREIVNCQYGWEYDTAWYKSTISSQENWVCDKELYVAHSFTACRIGDLVGTLIFGNLGDVVGRKPVLLISIILLIVGTIMCILTAQYYYWFLLAAFIENSTTASLFQAPLLIAMEISREEDRGHVNVLQSLGWSIGNCLLPLIMWWSKDWVIFLLLTSLPSGIYFFLHCYGIESPRWLVSKKKYSRAAEELRKIAKANKSTLPSNLEAILEQVHEEEEKLYGFLGIFSYWRLARNSLACMYIWTIVSIAYYFLTLNVENIGGNPFLNFVWLSLVEFPGALSGKYICDRWGRKIGHRTCFVNIILGCFVLIFTVKHPNLEWVTIVVSTFLKFACALGIYSINLQCLEVYPTCLRQTGMALLFITSGSFGFVGPYIKHVGNTVDIRYPYIVFVIVAIVAILLGALLPETLNRQLPETVAEAQTFGKRQINLKVLVPLEVKGDELMSDGDKEKEK